ncbi:hypothetical protein QCA50_007429 [Cerrena zonata]|uniref:Uncharacterized protein n=1 Tax=Cerrena zonata TaxID=2478898 RepID=A0AAW0GA02_9APHY
MVEEVYLCDAPSPQKWGLAARLCYKVTAMSCQEIVSHHFSLFLVPPPTVTLGTINIPTQSNVKTWGYWVRLNILSITLSRRFRRHFMLAHTTHSRQREGFPSCIIEAVHIGIDSGWEVAIPSVRPIIVYQIQIDLLSSFLRW